MMNHRMVCVIWWLDRLQTWQLEVVCPFLAQNIEGKITFLEVTFRQLLTLKLKQRHWRAMFSHQILPHSGELWALITSPMTPIWFNCFDISHLHTASYVQNTSALPSTSHTTFPLKHPNISNTQRFTEF